MAEQRRSIGFLASIGDEDVKSFVWPEGVLALLFGGGGGIYLLGRVSVDDRMSLVGDSLTSLGVLLGVVFAAFALVFSQLTDDYMAMLDKSDDGIIGFLRPFVFAVGCQVITLFAAMAYRGAAKVIPSQVEVGLFLFWAFMFSFAVLDVVALARNVSMHSVWRAKLVHARREAEAGNIRDLRPPKDQTGS